MCLAMRHYALLQFLTSLFTGGGVHKKGMERFGKIFFIEDNDERQSLLFWPQSTNTPQLSSIITLNTIGGYFIDNSSTEYSTITQSGGFP